MSWLNRFRDQPHPAPAPGNPECHIQVALSGPVLPAEDWFHEALAELNSATSIRGYHADGHTASFTVAELTREGPAEIGWGTIALRPGPLPGADLAGLCTRSWHWPQAAETLCAHTHHWVVCVTTDTTHFHNAMVTGRLLAALSRLPECLGACFPLAGLVQAPAALRAHCDTQPDALPVQLWVNFPLQAHYDGSTTLRTQGLRQFGVPEIEIVHSHLPYEELYQRAQEFAGNLMKAGPVLKDGDTVNSATDERHLVRHEPSIFDPQQTVCRIYL
jgi:hypothetical protein